MAAAGAAAAGIGSSGGLVSGLFATGLASQANKNAKKAARRAWKRSVHAYKHRYQWTMEDMRKAGLNPLLAYSQGGGGAPQATAAATHMASADIGGTAAKIGEAVTRATTAKEQRKLMDAQRLEVLMRQNLAFQQAGVAEANAKSQNLDNQLKAQRNAFYEANPNVRNAGFMRESFGNNLLGTAGAAAGGFLTDQAGSWSAKNAKWLIDATKRQLKRLGDRAPSWVPEGKPQDYFK